MNEFNTECASLGLHRQDDSSRGNEGQTEKRATRKSETKRRTKGLNADRYLKDSILHEQEDELYWQEDCILYEQEEEHEDGGGGGDDAEEDAGGEFYDDSYPWHGAEQGERWYNQNILSNPRRTTLVRQLMVHTERPPISPPFVPGIYMSERLGCEYCRGPVVEALVIFPGMKTARWVLISVGCEPQNESTTLKGGHYTCKKLYERISNHRLDVALLEDYELLVDYALDPSLDTYEARINGNEIVFDQKNENGCRWEIEGIVGKAVHRSELSPEALASYDGIFNEDLSDWLIDYGGCLFHLRVRL
jgi:hypothetical protein